MLNVNDTDPAGILSAVHELLAQVYKPAIHSLDDWGALNETPHGRKTSRAFLDSYDNFLQFLQGLRLPLSAAFLAFC